MSTVFLNHGLSWAFFEITGPYSRSYYICRPKLWPSLREQTTFLALVSPTKKRASAILSWKTISVSGWASFFSSNHNSTVIFVELTHVGFAWGSWLQWPAVFKLEGQVFKLEGVMFTMSLEGVCLPDFHHFSVLVVREAQKAKGSGILNRSTATALTVLLLRNFCDMWTRNFNPRDALFLLFNFHDSYAGPPLTPLLKEMHVFHSGTISTERFYHNAWNTENNCWFSHDLTQIQTTKLSSLLRF